MTTETSKRQKLHIKKGDQVRVIAGNDKGKEGRVLRVIPEKGRVIIEGINIRVRHTKPSAKNQQGGRIPREMPIHVSNVMPLDRQGNPTRVGRRRIEDETTGRTQWVRYAKTNGEEIDR